MISWRPACHLGVSGRDSCVPPHLPLVSGLFLPPPSFALPLENATEFGYAVDCDASTMRFHASPMPARGKPWDWLLAGRIPELEVRAD